MICIRFLKFLADRTVDQIGEYKSATQNILEKKHGKIFKRNKNAGLFK